MQPPSPVLVADRFPELLTALVNLLSGLSLEEWKRPTAATGWSVHDIALHLLGDDIGILSRKRDNFREPSASITTWDELVVELNQNNERWVQALRRTSPPLLCDLLRFTGDQVNVMFRSMDPYALGGPVSWAGPERAPVWLDIAREFTERWHHQQHIRDAVGQTGLTEPYYLEPVLATFVHSLPQAYRHLKAVYGTAITLTITGDSGGVWSVIREGEKWILYSGKPARPHAHVTLPADIAWRLFTKGMSRESARRQALFEGDLVMGEALLDAAAIIA